MRLDSRTLLGRFVVQTKGMETMWPFVIASAIAVVAFVGGVRLLDLTQSARAEVPERHVERLLELFRD